MERAIVTRADDNIKEMTEITHPVIKKYADKCNAEFLILKYHNKLHPHYRILQLFEILDNFDRVLVLDSDMLVLKSCENLFNIVPTDKIGVMFEDVGSRRDDRRNRMKKIQSEREDVSWTEGYINTGCFLVSNCHKELFKDTTNLWMNLGYDDVELGYRIHKMKFEIYELPYVYNFMSMFTEPWAQFRKSDAKILHYAGNGFSRVPKLTQIKQDYLILRKYGEI